MWVELHDLQAIVYEATSLKQWLITYWTISEVIHILLILIIQISDFKHYKIENKKTNNVFGYAFACMFDWFLRLYIKYKLLACLDSHPHNSKVDYISNF